MDFNRNNFNEEHLVGEYGTASQRKGRFIIQELDEEKFRFYPLTKKFSMDSKKVVFSYTIHDTEYSPSDKTLSSPQDIYFGNKNSSGDNKTNFTSKLFLSHKSLEEANSNDCSNSSNPIKIETYIFCLDEANLCFINFVIIWRKFTAKRNRILNLYNDIDKKIYIYKSKENLMDKLQHRRSSSYLIPSAGASEASESLRAQEEVLRSSKKSKNTNRNKNCSIKETKFSLVNFKNNPKNNSEKRNICFKRPSSKYLFPWTLRYEKTGINNSQGDRLSFLKLNRKTICSSLQKSKVSFIRQNSLKNAFSSNKLKLHSNLIKDEPIAIEKSESSYKDIQEIAQCLSKCDKKPFSLETQKDKDNVEENILRHINNKIILNSEEIFKVEQNFFRLENYDNQMNQPDRLTIINEPAYSKSDEKAEAESIDMLIISSERFKEARKQKKKNRKFYDFHQKEVIIKNNNSESGMLRLGSINDIISQPKEILNYNNTGKYFKSEKKYNNKNLHKDEVRRNFGKAVEENFKNNLYSDNYDNQVLINTFNSLINRKNIKSNDIYDINNKCNVENTHLSQKKCSYDTINKNKKININNIANTRNAAVENPYFKSKSLQNSKSSSITARRLEMSGKNIITSSKSSENTMKKNAKNTINKKNKDLQMKADCLLNKEANLNVNKLKPICTNNNIFKPNKIDIVNITKGLYFSEKKKNCKQRKKNPSGFFNIDNENKHKDFCNEIDDYFNFSCSSITTQKSKFPLQDPRFSKFCTNDEFTKNLYLQNIHYKDSSDKNICSSFMNYLSNKISYKAEEIEFNNKKNYFINKKKKKTPDYFNKDREKVLNRHFSKQTKDNINQKFNFIKNLQKSFAEDQKQVIGNNYIKSPIYSTYKKPQCQKIGKINFQFLNKSSLNLSQVEADTNPFSNIDYSQEDRRNEEFSIQSIVSFEILGKEKKVELESVYVCSKCEANDK